MGKPNFFIVGAPKCGTTALSEYLREHPAVLMSRPKEPHFFSRDFPYYYAPGRATLDHYLRLFDAAGPEHLAVGEASVWYLYSREALPAIRAFDPGARIIAMVRNPLELVPSLHSQMFYVRDEDQPDPARAWALQETRRAGRSLPPGVRVPAFLQYREAASLGAQIARAHEVFPPEQLLTLVFDDLREDPAAVYARTLEFLGLPHDGRDEFPRINVNKAHRRAIIARITQRPPRPLLAAAAGIKRLLGIERLGVLERIRARNRRQTERPAPDPAFVAEMRESFRDDVALLSRLLDRDLGHWLDAPAAEGARRA